MSFRIICGDALEVLGLLPSASAHCCITSPPYWGLRHYGVDGQLGLEPSPDEYVAALVAVFREVRRVLRDDGTLWLNLGDSYCSIGHKKSSSGYGTTGLAGGKAQENHPLRRENNAPGLKHKDLVGIPWRVAFALQADGWWLRSDIIWSKPNPMPESVTDRPTKAHEYLFLLTKAERYYYDAAAIKEPGSENSHGGGRYHKDRHHVASGRCDGGRENFANAKPAGELGRNKRSVWTVAPAPFKEAHFATFPPKLIEPCILAGCPAGGTVLDPFGGAGTTVLVADRLGRDAIGIELNPAYVKMAEQRCCFASMDFRSATAPVFVAPCPVTTKRVAETAGEL